MTLANAVGIFGGSFNPVHLGHLKLAEEIQSRCRFQPLYIVPAKNPPHKTAYEIAEKHRLEMVKLAFAGVPNTEVSTFEMESPGPSYAIRTIEHFTRKHPGTPIYFVLGADAFHDLPTWYAFPDVLEACNYIVVSRAGWDQMPTESEQSKLSRRLSKMTKAGLLTLQEAQSPFSRVLRMRTGHRLCILDAELPEVSSTEIRVRMQLNETVNDLVPAPVEQYLKSQGLYGTKKVGQ